MHPTAEKEELLPRITINNLEAHLCEISPLSPMIQRHKSSKDKRS